MMKPLRQILIYALLTLTVVLSQKDSDEGRPYEFGFTIEGQQHRHEKKDQNGIVQGEFGFITADGVYHVTVYATDESGSFKILSMRNIRISAPLDGSPATGPISPEAGKYLGKQKQIKDNIPAVTASIPAVTAGPQQLPQQPHPEPPQPQVPQQIPQQIQQGAQPPQITQKPGPYEFTTQPTIKPACSGCGYVTTQKPSQFQFQNPAFQKPPGAVNVPVTSSGVQNNQNLRGIPLSPSVVLPLTGPQSIEPRNSYNQQQNFQTSQNQPQNFPGEQQQSSILPPVGAQNVQKQNYNQQQNLQINRENVGNFQNQPQSTQYQQNFPGQQQEFSQNVQNAGEGIFQPPGSELLPPGTNGHYQETINQPQTQLGFGGGGNQQINSQGNLFASSLSGQNQEVNSISQQQQQYYQGGNVLTADRTESAGGQLSGGSLGTATGSGSLAQANKQVSKLPPISVSDNTIHVSGSRPLDIPIKDKYPGMTDGLPDGIEEKDIKDLLYKFHYTVGFHGHYEKGLKNGAKIGGYFVNGRDGISRVVTYIADENGYRPKFKFINLGLDSPDTPKEGTEKQFGLKSFEFVWYPLD